MNMWELDAYLERIGHPEACGLNLETLRGLHWRHPLAIPFENTASFLDQPVALNHEALQDKLVGARRGGYCFEQNLLFSAVLRTIGFEVWPLAARVLWRRPEGMVLPRTHMLLLVVVAGERWICDVGFGGLTPTTPVCLEHEEVQGSPHEDFRVCRRGSGYRLEAAMPEGWRALYQFDLQSQQQADLEMMNWYVSTHPDSRFRNELLLARPAREGRHALHDREYTWYDLTGKARRQTIADETELGRVLREEFALPDGEDRAAALWRRLAGEHSRHDACEMY